MIVVSLYFTVYLYLVGALMTFILIQMFARIDRPDPPPHWWVKLAVVLWPVLAGAVAIACVVRVVKGPSSSSCRGGP